MKNVLDLGSGDGFFAYILSKNKDNKAYGIDVSKESIGISKKRYPMINFQVMDSEKMSFKSGTFDEVYAMDVLEHVDNLRKALVEVRRVLKTKGKFVVNVPYHKSEKWLIKIRPTYFSEIHHVRIFKERELEHMIIKMGFKLKNKKKTGFLHHIELFFLFKRKVDSKKQTSIGSWRDSFVTKVVHAVMLYFDPVILKTPLFYIPIWIITLPVGYAVNYVGNKFLPKSMYYEFIKIK